MTINQITKIEVAGFRSLNNFSMDLAKFTCLVGRNDSGKTSILRFMEFLSGLLQGETSSDLILTETVRFRIDFNEGHWLCRYDPLQKKCEFERWSFPNCLLEVRNDTSTIYNAGSDSHKLKTCCCGQKYRDIIFEYKGSIVSTLKPSLLPPTVLGCKKLFTFTNAVSPEFRYSSTSRIPSGLSVMYDLTTTPPLKMYDEIENGIAIDLMERVANAITTTQKQVIVTTHSPLFLNYLNDDTAKKGVVFVYKDKSGNTHAAPFFSIPSLAEKLTVMGPGEAFADTDLLKLIDEIKPK